jgi:hypothetical protein
VKVQLVEEQPLQQRKSRRPSHRFQVRQKPYQIQPFMIAPVLPGETLDNLLMQARVVTDPITNPLIGWWCEYYFFYVKWRDLDDRQALIDMALTDTATTALQTAAQTETYHYASSIDFANKCLKRVTEEYFRNEGEAWNVATLGNLPLASVNQDSWLDSIVDATTTAPTANLLQEAPDLTVIAAYQTQYDRMRQMRLTDMTFHDWLETYGENVSTPVNESEYKPELVRYLRQWQYPSNTIDPTNGTPTSAVSWSIAERADKARHFKEPGFLFGVCVFRPKVYFRNQRGSASHMLDSALPWLPAVLADEPYTSLKSFTNANGPLTGTTNGYWIDVRDLYLYGDQFVNFAMTGTGDNAVALPTAALGKRYCSSTDVDNLFVNAAGGKNLVRQDGVVNLNIRSKVPFASDYT